MIIRSKIESVHQINRLGLNKLPEWIFQKNQEARIAEFLKKYPAEYYAVRDKSKLGGTFKLKVPADKIFEETREYELFSINVSSANYVENQILVGEALFQSNNEVYLTVSTDPAASVRDALSNPAFNLKTDIFDKELNKIPGFDFLYKYVVDHGLQDIIIEFSLFNKRVGTRNDNIVIYELRTHY